MEYKKLIIRGISYSQAQSGAYTLLLEQSDSRVKLPIVIGNFEAQSISMGLEKDLKTLRPLTHDLFTKFVETTHHTLESVVIYKLVDGVFFSNINFMSRMIGNSITLDARTSDAVAMAVRFDAPIYTTQSVLDEAGFFLDVKNHNWEEELKEQPFPTRLKSLEELNEELNEAVRNEDFDLAQKLQEEIQSRSKKID